MRLEARVNAVYDQLTANERELADSLCGPPSESGISQELVRRHILPAPPQTQKGA